MQERLGFTVQVNWKSLERNPSRGASIQSGKILSLPSWYRLSCLTEALVSKTPSANDTVK